MSASEGAVADEFDDPDDALFPVTVCLPKSVEWIDFMDMRITESMSELIKHIEQDRGLC